jgi:nucleoside-diphosphate-sugar epimerase
VHAQDISRAFLAVLEAPREVVHDQAFNVGRDEDVVQIRDIANQVAARFDVPVTFAEGAAPDKRDYRVDFRKVSEVLPSFRPGWTVADGIDELAVDMEKIGLTEDAFTDRYVRLRRINALKAEGRLDDLLRVR